MLIVVLLLGVWLWRTRQWVEARREYQRENSMAFFLYMGRAGHSQVSSPGLLFWLWREEGVAVVELTCPDTLDPRMLPANPPQEAIKARALFPEAYIHLEEDHSKVDHSFEHKYRWYPGGKWVSFIDARFGGIDIPSLNGNSVAPSKDSIRDGVQEFPLDPIAQ